MITKLQIIPTYYFGKDVVRLHLANELLERKIKKVLLAYGGGSIKRNHLYDEIMLACKKAHVKVIEHSGIEPNPRDEGIYQASLKCRKSNVDLIIAAGGGSVIDAAKVIGICATNPQYKNAWDYVLDSSKVTKKSIPLFSIITLAATGSENNAGSVITNAKTHYKRSVGTPTATPLVCFEDPKYTLTLSWWQTACGIFDIFSHLCEQYYDTNANFEWTKQYILANMRVCLECAKKLAKNNQDWDARSNLLWTSSWALNGLPTVQTSGGDWTTHRLEHAMSGLWDIEHGAGLALLTPGYLKYMCKCNAKFKQYSLEIGKAIFGTSNLDGFFNALNKFISLLGLPKKMTDFKSINKVTDKDIKWLVDHFMSVIQSNDTDITPTGNFKKKLARTLFESVK